VAVANRKCTVCGNKKPLKDYPKTSCGKYFRRTCRECYATTQQGYKSNTPEAYLFSRINNKSKARAQVKINKDDLRDMWVAQGGKCAVTGLHMTYSPRPMKNSTGLNASVDRIDQTKGYEKGNVRLVCFRVNLMRHTGEDADLMWWCKQIIEGIEGG